MRKKKKPLALVTNNDDESDWAIFRNRDVAKEWVGDRTNFKIKDYDLEKELEKERDSEGK